MAPPPPPAKPAAAAPRPGDAAARAAAKAPPKATGPARRWMLAATAAIALEALLLGLALARSGQVVALNLELDNLNRASLQADEIRQAWDELAAQGALLKSRLSGKTELEKAESLKQLRKDIAAAAKTAGVSLSISAPDTVKTRRGVKASRLVLTGSGSEARILTLLTLLDHLPAVVETDTLQLTGLSKGVVYLKLSLRHFELKSRVQKELKKFVAGLPGVPGQKFVGAGYERKDPVFMPVVVSEEDALRGWPRIILNGFSGDKALMTVAGDTRTIQLGDTITGGILYTDKLSVNQAMLIRTTDRAEVILTVGSTTYSVKPREEVRGTSEYVLTIQKKASSDLLNAVTQ
jgi:hypothetical protein